MPQPTEQQPLRDAKAALHEEIQLKEKLAKLEKDCDDKEVALKEEEETRQKLMEAGLKRAEEEHKTRCRKLEEQHLLHREETRRNREPEMPKRRRSPRRSSAKSCRS